MAQYVIFSGDTKKIYIKPGVTDLDVQIDLYSDWKEWVLEDDNAKWLAAFRTFGGDETSESQFAPRYFFLINEWKVVATDVQVVIQTNLYSDDGLSPVEITNSAVLIRNSDVAVVKSELEQRLDYGDRVYYDETTSYSGSTYPNGTIAQPVNNPVDAITIAMQYNINDIYCLSDITMPGISGMTFNGWEIYATKPNLSFVPISANTYDNMLIDGFDIDCDFGGGINIINNSIITDVRNFSGIVKNTQMLGNFHIANDAVLSYCYSGIAGSNTPVYDMNSGVTTTMSIRAYSGGVDLKNCDTSGCTTTIELIAGQIILDDTCTDGYIDLRGVGYITNNSSGSTVNTTGFIDSFETYVEETRATDEVLAYSNQLFIDTVLGVTGHTYPVGTVASPVNNLPELFYLSNALNIKNIHVRSDIIASGLTFVADDFTMYSDTPGLELYVYSGDKLENAKLHDFTIVYADFYGNFHTFHECILKNIYNLAGQVYLCGIDGSDGAEINIYNNTSFINCFPATAGVFPTFNLVNPDGTNCSIRDWNGDILINQMNHDDDVVVLEVSAGHVQITSGACCGVIDIRGVGYLTDNSQSGCTVITTGFINSFETYVEETRETDERLAYGDAIYYDETSIYTGTTYPIGTIVQPVNNAIDAAMIVGIKGINKFLVLSDITFSGITEQYFENYSIVGVKENLTLNLELNPIHNYYSNMYFENLIISGSLTGGTNTLNNCDILYLEYFQGLIKDSKLIGDIHLYENTDMINCYSGDELSTSNREIPRIFLDNTDGVVLDLRNYSGDLILEKMELDDDSVVIDVNSGKIEISSGCTNGTIEIRGVGSLIDNSGSGCTVDYTGFVNSFQSYIEETRELDEQLAYQNHLYYDPVNGETGHTYPIGTSVQPSNNIPELYYLSEFVTNIKNIVVREEFLASGVTALLPPGAKMDNFTIVADSPGVDFFMYDAGISINVNIVDFQVRYVDLGGLPNKFENCGIHQVDNAAGSFVECLLFSEHEDDYIKILNNVNFINCSPANAGATPKICLVNTGGTNCAFSSWSGDLNINEVQHENDKVTINVSSGHIILSSGCTAGTIDLRGVGYLENNAGTGCTVITTGFINSFETYVESTRELDEQLAYGNELFLDMVSGSTGVTYPTGTVASPVNNLPNLYYLSNELNIKNIRVRNNLLISGTTFVTEKRSINLYSDTPGVPFYLYSNILENSGIYKFDIIYADFYGNENAFEQCILRQVDNLSGHLVACDLDGGRDPNEPYYGSGLTSINVYGNTTFVNCHPRHAGDAPTINLVNPSGTTCGFRSWNGDIILNSMEHSDDKLIMETIGSKITINSGCTDGLIEIRGVCEVIDNSGPNCNVKKDAQLDAAPTRYNGQIVIDTIYGSAGINYPIGTISNPVNNIPDAMTLLSTYNLNKIYIKGSLEFSSGEDLSHITFTSERSTGNYLTITSAVTNYTYIDNLTCLNIVQDGPMRYTTSVLVNVDNFDGGAKDCLIVDSNINIVGNGSNYFTNCDRYVTDATAFTTFDVSDKNLNLIRCRGNFTIDNKTSSNTIAIDLTAGLMVVNSSCTNGIVAINGITEVEDYTGTGCTVLLKAISNVSITDHVWDEQISDHLQVGSTGYKLNTASSGGVDYDALASAVWDAQLSGYTSSGGTLAGDMVYSINDTIIQITGLTTLNSSIERILGLSQQNYRLSNQIYDGNNCLLSASIKIYPSATDCDNDTNPIAEYLMSATYSATGQMLDYKVTDV